MSLEHLAADGNRLGRYQCEGDDARHRAVNSFDYPIGERQKVGWNFTPYRFGCLEVEHQFERSWLLNG